MTAFQVSDAHTIMQHQLPKSVHILIVLGYTPTAGPYPQKNLLVDNIWAQSP